MSSHFHCPKGFVLFLHIPKCGGTFVDHILAKLGLRGENSYASCETTNRHGLRQDYKVLYDYSFTFVRHPLSWYESCFRYWTKERWREFEPESLWHPWRPLRRCKSDTFAGFMENVVRHEPAFVTRMFEWYVGPPGRQFVDFVGRMENLAADLAKVLRLCGVSVSAEWIAEQPKVNVSPETPTPWPDDLREEVLRLESPTIQRFYNSEKPWVTNHVLSIS